MTELTKRSSKPKLIRASRLVGPLLEEGHGESIRGAFAQAGASTDENDLARTCLIREYFQARIFELGWAPPNESQLARKPELM